jgi:hypothetical protein
MQAKSLQIQAESHQLQKRRAEIAEKQLGAASCHPYSQSSCSDEWNFNVDGKRLRKEQRDLSRNFSDTARRIRVRKSRSSGQDAKLTRREPTKEENTSTVILWTVRTPNHRGWMTYNTFSRSSCFSKNELQLLQVFLPTEEAPDGVTGSEIFVDNQPEGE